AQVAGLMPGGVPALDEGRGATHELTGQFAGGGGVRADGVEVDPVAGDGVRGEHGRAGGGGGADDVGAAHGAVHVVHGDGWQAERAGPVGNSCGAVGGAADDPAIAPVSHRGQGG